MIIFKRWSYLPNKSVTSKNTWIFYQDDQIKEDTVSWACSTSDIRNSYKNLVTKPNTEPNQCTVSHKIISTPKNRWGQEGPKDQLLSWKGSWPAHAAKLVDLWSTFCVKSIYCRMKSLKMLKLCNSQLPQFCFRHASLPRNAIFTWM